MCAGCMPALRRRSPGETLSEATFDDLDPLGIAEPAAIERQEAVLAELLDVHVTEPAGPVIELGRKIASDGCSPGQWLARRSQKASLWRAS